MRSFHTLFIGFLLSASLIGCTSHPVYNLSNEYVPTNQTGSKPTIELVEKTIMSGARRRGWSPRLIKPGLIEASISVRAHRATVEIPFSRESYSIIYKNSENLDFRNGKIHRNYNNWVIKLSRTIQDEFGVNTQNY